MTKGFDFDLVATEIIEAAGNNNQEDKIRIRIYAGGDAIFAAVKYPDRGTFSTCTTAIWKPEYEGDVLIPTITRQDTEHLMEVMKTVVKESYSASSGQEFVTDIHVEAILEAFDLLNDADAHIWVEEEDD